MSDNILIRGREVVCWSCNPDAETLENSIDNALDAHFSDRPEGEPVPETIEVYGYARLQPEYSDCGHPLEDVLERLDEYYGNPDDSTDKSPALIAAENAFVEAVLNEYKAWQCERVHSEVVNVAEYI